MTRAPSLRAGSPRVASIIGWLSIGVGFAMIIADPYHMLTGFLVCAYGCIWFAVAPEWDTFYEMDRVFVGLLGMYATLPFVLGTFFPEDFTKATLDTPTAICVLLAMLGTFVGFRSRLPERLARIDLRLDGEWDPRESRFVAWGLIAAGLVLLVMLFLRVGINVYINEAYNESYQLESGIGYLTAGTFLIMAGLLSLAVTLAKYRDRIPWIIILLFLGFALSVMRSGRRRFVLELALGLLAVIQLYMKPLRLRTVLVFVLATALVFTMVGQMRAFMSQGWEGMTTYLREDFDVEQLRHSMDEFQSIPMVVYETVRYFPEQQEYRMGATYVEAFEILIPKKIHPDRPLGPSQWYVWTFDPLVASRGGGYAFSHIAEAYMNFGYFGPPIVFFFIAVAIRTLLLFRRVNPTSRSRILLYAGFFMCTIVLIRADFASVLKMSVTATGIPIFVAAKFLGRRSPRRMPAVSAVPGRLRPAYPAPLSGRPLFRP
jgi:oligosaccharide repeat unit polymerase